MKRLFYILISPLRTAYWFLMRPATRGVKCLIEHEGRFLMIRNSYGHKQWTFPGGGVDRSEAPEQAAVREALEEVGIHLTSPILLGTFSTTRQYKHDTVYCYYAMIDSSAFIIDRDEVAEAAWFPKGALPDARSSSVELVLDLYRQHLNSQSL